MALSIHKKKVATLKHNKTVPQIQEATVPHIQEATVSSIQEAVVREISPERFNKLMEESMKIIDENRILIDNYYVDTRWLVNGINSFENVIDAPSMKSIEGNKIVINKPFSTEILSNSPLQNRISDEYKRTFDEKEIRLRKILIEDISKPMPLKRKYSDVIEVSILAKPLQDKLPQSCAIIPKKKKRTESDSAALTGLIAQPLQGKLPQGQQASAGTPDHIIVF